MCLELLKKNQEINDISMLPTPTPAPLPVPQAALREGDLRYLFPDF